MIRVNRYNISSVVALFLMLGMTLLHAQPSYYVYKGKRVSLELEKSSLAIRYRNEKSAAQSVTHTQSLGVRASTARSVGYGRWNVLTLDQAMSDTHEAHQHIATLSSSSDVEFASPVFHGEHQTPIILTQDVLVQFKPEYANQVKTLLKTIAPELSIINDHFGNMSGAYQLRSTAKNGFEVLATANRLVEEGYAEWSEPDMIFSGESDLIPNDPGFANQWGMHNTGQFGGTAGMDMKGDLAWNITTGDTAVKVLVIDCGVQQNHPDIHQLPGVDFTGQGGGGGPVSSIDDHGTAVAGCITGVINNGIGITGIAPNCYIVSARAVIKNSLVDESITTQSSWTVNALAYAATHGIRITNNSNSYFGVPTSAIDAEYQMTHDSLGMIHFASAGNSGNTAIHYPASLPVVNAVGALTMTGTKASFSNYGPGIDFAAPGDSIYTTDRTGSAGYNNTDYVMYRGTSFASPYAAGVAALILSRFPTFTAQQVEAKMQNTCTDIGTPGKDTVYGWGFVNAYNAVRSSCIISQASNITVPVDPGQCGAIVNFPTPSSSGGCTVTCNPPSGSFFSVGTTIVTCSDTSGDAVKFTVTVTGGSIASAQLRDDFNRANNPLPGSNKWVLIQNQPSSGSMAIVNNAVQPTSSAGNTNFGGVVWDSLISAGTEASVTLAQKSGNTNSTSFFLYARMNNKDYNTGVGYRLRYLEQSGTDILEIHRVGTGYANATTIASTKVELNPGDVVTFRVLCDNKTMVGLVNGVQVISATDGTFMPAQWYFALRGCVFTTPIRFDNFKISPQQSGTPIPPPSPTLLTPANLLGNQPTTTMLTWNASSGATSYCVQVATDSLFSGMVVNDSTVTSTSRQVGLLSNNVTYYWRVNAKNSGGTSAYSTVWNFTTIPAAPSPPILLLPTNQSIGQPTTLTLSWNASSGAVSYRVQVATDSLFAVLIVNDSTLIFPTKQISPLSNGTKYYWRVNAKNSGGTSAYSAVWNFTTIPAVPSSPLLLSPTNQSNGQPTTVTLNWNASSGAVSYRIQLATDSLFGGVIVDDSTVTLTSRQIGSLSNSTTYYWRVNAKNSGGTSAFSATWNFTTIVATPAIPALVAPANGLLAEPTTLTLGWNSSAGATMYRCQVATDSFFTALVVNDSTLTTTSRQVGPLSGNTIYYWRVNASNVGGTSTYSLVWNFTTVIAPPSPPVLVSPSNNAINQPTSLTVTWNASAGAVSYRIQVATDSIFSAIVLDDSTVTSTSRSISGLSNATKYCWRVNAKNSGGTSVYSTAWNFTTIVVPPLTPVLASPTNGAVNQPTTLTLGWNSSAGATTYRCQVATDSFFTALVVNDSTLTTTSRQVGPLSGNTIYYWRVNASNVGGTSTYSPLWNFTTVIAPPSPPVLVSPSNSAINQPTTLTVTWNASAGAVSYRIQVATDSIFSAIVLDDSTLTSTTRSLSGLSNATKYCWRVNARNGGGTSTYSTVWAFTTIIAPPSSPTLAVPANGAINQSVTLTLNWNSSAGATSYRCQVATDSLFSSLVVNDSTVTTTSRQIGPLSYNTTYYWRVRAQNVGGSSNDTPAWNFTSLPSPPLAPVLASPTNGAGNQPTTLTLNWNASVGAVSYRVRVATDSLFTIIILDDSTLTTISRSVSGLSNATKYYWEVNAKNTGGTSPYSSVWTFTTVPAIPLPPALTLPANGATCQSTALTLSWSASSGATSYRLKVATDSLFAIMVVDDSTLTSTTRSVTSLTGNTTYYWRVNAKNVGGTSAFSSTWNFTTFPNATLRDDFNRVDGPLAGSNKWALIQNQPSSGAMNIVGSMIQASSSAGNTNFGGVVWDSLVSAGTEASITVKQKSGNTIYTSLFIYAKMNNKDYNTGTGYRIRYFEQSGTDILEIHRVGPGYSISTVLASVSKELVVGDVITFRILCDNKTMVGLVNGVQVITATDATYLPAQWYFAVRSCVFPTPARFDDFAVSSPPSIASATLPTPQHEVMMESGTPKAFVLDQNYPNPFNPTTTISYALPLESHVNVKIYDVLGRVVQTLIADELQGAGYKSVDFDASKLASGVYFYRLEAIGVEDVRTSFTQIRKMMLIK